MYISNNNNIGMATLLHNNKTCMKPHTNVGNVGEMGVISIAGNTINGTITTAAVPVCNSSQHLQEVSNLVSSTGVMNGGIVSTAVSGTNSGILTTSTTNNILVPAPTQAVLITNNATGASSILTYQQYQQNILHQQPHQRLLIAPNLVSLPVNNVMSAGGAGLAVITKSSSAQNSNMSITVRNNTTITNNSNNGQNAFLVSTSSPNVNNITPINSFQQQFQQQIAANAAHSSSTNIRAILPIQQQQQQSQQPMVAVAQNKCNNNKNHCQSALVISRSNNNVIASNAVQRLSHAGLLSNTSSTIQSSPMHQQHQSPIIINNIPIQMVNGTGQTQLVNVVKAVNNSTNSSIVTISGAINSTTPSVAAVASSLTTATCQPHKQQTRCSVLSFPHIKQHASTSSSSTSLIQLPSVTPLQSQIKQQTRQQLIKVALNGEPCTNMTREKAKITNSVQQQQLTNKTLLGKAFLTNGHKNNATSSSKNISVPSVNMTTKAIISTSNNNNIYTSITTSASATMLNSSIMKPNDNVTLNHSSFSNNTNNTKNNTVNITTTTITTTTITITKTTPTILTTTTTTTESAAIAGAIAVSSNSNSIHNNDKKITENNISSKSDQININNKISNGNNSIPNAINVNPTSSTISSTSCYNSLNATQDNIVNTTINNNNVVEVKQDITTSITNVTAEQEVEPEIDIVINNVVCSFSVRCHLNLREIALRGSNVEYRRENGMVTMKLRRPYTTASIWSSGRITCTGATSEEQAKIAGRRFARCLQTLGFKVRFQNFRVVNVLGTCSMPWAIKIVNFSEKYKREASYEPELHPGVTYKLRFPKATLKIFSTGSITVTAASVLNVQAAIEHIYPLVYEFRKKRSPEELECLRQKQQHNAGLLDITEYDNDINLTEGNDDNEGNGNSSHHLKRRNDDGPKPNKKQCFKFIERKHPFKNPLTTCNSTNASSNNADLDADNELNENNPQSFIVNDNDDDIITYDPNDLIEGPDEDINE